MPVLIDRRRLVVGLLATSAALATSFAASAALAKTGIVATGRLAELLNAAAIDYCLAGRAAHQAWVRWQAAARSAKLALLEEDQHPLFAPYQERWKRWQRANAKVTLIVGLIERRADASALGTALRAKAAVWREQEWEDATDRCTPKSALWLALDEIERSIAAGEPT